jgi:F5/8 type C domain
MRSRQNLRTTHYGINDVFLIAQLMAVTCLMMIGAISSAQAQQFPATNIQNVAAGKPTSQSSVAYGATSSRAVDGNTNGDFSANSVTHTLNDAGAWWRVDLGAPHAVYGVTLFNRTDCCADRLSNFTVEYLSANGSVIKSLVHSGTAGAKVDFSQFAVAVNSVRVRLNGTNALSLAEVEVFGAPAANVAARKPTRQSSVAYGGISSRAIDGNTNGEFAANSVTHTNYEAGAWWRVDLGAPHMVFGVTLFNRSDCCADRLSNFTLEYLDKNDEVISSYAYTGTAGPKVVFSRLVSAVHSIRVRLNGTNALSLAEVQVQGVRVENVAVNRPASQSSTVYDAAASRAVDGNADGNFSANSVTHTDLQTNPWWRVDLGDNQFVHMPVPHEIYSVTVFNRADCCTDRLSNFYLDYLDANGAVIAIYSHSGAVGRRVNIDRFVSGVYSVRIRLSGTNHLSLAEVRVLGVPTKPSLDISAAIPLRGHVYRANQFAVSLTGSAIKGTTAYEINFDTGSYSTSIPYGALNKSALTVLRTNIRDPLDNLVDEVKGQLALTGSDGKTKYIIDGYVFYAIKNPDGSDMPDDRTAQWSASIMGAFPMPGAFPYEIAKKYQANGLGIGYGMISKAAYHQMAVGWSSFKSYLIIGNNQTLISRLNWRSYAPGADWYPGQPGFDPIVVPGFKIKFSFPMRNGTILSDIIASDQIATLDTGAPDMTMRLGSNDPQLSAPYKSFFTPDGVPWWYTDPGTVLTVPGDAVEVAFAGSFGKTCSYKFVHTTDNSTYMPDKVIIGAWSSGVPWANTTLTPRNRMNMGNTAFYHFPVVFWDMEYKRVGIYC